jgi:hypothetical protein
MSRPFFRFRCFAAVLIALAWFAPVPALIMVGGKEPVIDHNWPTGTLDVANHKSRLSWYEGPPFGGGEWTFQYRGDTAALNEVLARFGQIKAPELLIIVHDGTLESPFTNNDKNAAGKADNTIDWSFTVWVPENFYHLFGNPSSAFSADQPQYRTDLPPPRLDVYVSEGRIDWERVQVPAGVRVTDERATSHGYKPEDGSVITGVAYDMFTAKPVAAVEVTVERYVTPPPPAEGVDLPKNPQKSTWEKVVSAVGDVDGRFEVKNVPAGSYQVNVRCAGYAPRSLGWTSFQQHTFKSETVRLSPAVEASGKVVEAGKNKPIEGVKVRVDQTISVDGRGYPQPEGRETTTDAQGKFTLPGLPRGEAQITAWVNGHYQVDMLKQHPVPTESLVLKMTGTGTIHVKVSGHDGKPVNNGNVSIWAAGGAKTGTWGAGANLKDDGTFTFDNVPVGKYLASADPGAQYRKEPKGTPFEVKAGQTVEVELTK